MSENHFASDAAPASAVNNMDREIADLTNSLNNYEDQCVMGPPVSEQDDRDRRSVCVRNVDYAAKAADLVTIFSPYGEIKQVTIKTHPDGTPKGYGYIELDSPESADACVAFCDSKQPTLNGRTLSVRSLAVHPLSLSLVSPLASPSLSLSPQCEVKRKNIPGQSRTRRGGGRGMYGRNAFPGRMNPMMAMMMASMAMMSGMQPGQFPMGPGPGFGRRGGGRGRFGRGGGRM